MKSVAGSVKCGILAAWFLSWPLFAQSTGELRGTVVDSSGAPVPGALVEIRSVVLIRPRQTGSLVNGEFRFPILPPGPYSILARQTGLLDATLDDVRIPLGETMAVRMELKLSTAASVTVDSDVVPVIDTASARMGITANRTMLQNLPLGRNYASAAAILGGVGSDLLGPTVFGASSLENTHTVDGVNVTGIKLAGQSKQLPLEFVQEVEVRTGGYEAEFGRSLGGNINVVTRSGGNDFHGDAFGYYDSGSLAASAQHDATTEAGVPAFDYLEAPLRYDVGFSLGGPLVKDRLWFFGAYDRAQVDQRYQSPKDLTYLSTGIQVNFEERSDRTTMNLFAATLTWAPTPSHSIAVSAFGDPTDYRGRTDAGPGFTAPYFFGVPVPGPESARHVDRRAGGTDVSARWDGFLGHALLQAQAGYHLESSRDRNDVEDRPALFAIRSGFIQSVAESGPRWLGDESYDRTSVKLTGGFTFAKHEVRLGVDYQVARSSSLGTFGGAERIHRLLAPDGSFRRALHTYFLAQPYNCTVLTDGSRGNFGLVDPSTCNAWQSTEWSRTDLTSRGLSVFLQDSYRPLSNLTVNIGLRYDQEELLDGRGTARLRLTDQWSPRLSIVWDPLRDGRSKVFASYGRYYQSMPQSLAQYIVSDSGSVVAFNGSSAPNDQVNDPAFGFPNAQLAVAGAVYVAKGVKGPYQDELVAGADFQIGASWSVGLKGVYRALGRALEDRCDLGEPGTGTSLPPAVILNKCAIISPGEGELGHLEDPSSPECFEDYPTNTTPRPCEGIRASRTYRGLEFAVQHRPTERAQLLVSYVYSRLNGNYEGFITTVDHGAVVEYPGFSPDFDGGPIRQNAFGRLLNDRTHQLKASGYYSLPFGLTAGLVASWASGQPLSLFSQNIDQPTHGFLLVPRGSYGELPSTYSIDLHLQCTVKVGAVSISPVVDVFNVTNVQRATARNQEYDTGAPSDQTAPPYTNPTNPNFGKDSAWQTPRLVRVAVRASF